MQLLKSILPAAALCLGLASAAQAQYTEQWGGIKDANSERVWRAPEYTGNFTQPNALTYAANYVVTDSVTGVVYDDWRVATVAEMDALMANPELADRMLVVDPVNPGTPPADARWVESEWSYWTSSSAGGSKGYLYPVRFRFLVATDPATGIDVTYDVELTPPQGVVWAWDRNKGGAPILLIRNGAIPVTPPPTSGGGGKPRK